MKKILLLTLAISMPLILSAQSDKAAAESNIEANMAAQETLTKAETPQSYWKCNGIISLNASATGLWNWAAGGNNNITSVAAANVTLLYKKNAIAWESNLDTDFGLTYLESDFAPWRKSNDKINFTTKFGWEFHKTWYLTVLGSFKSQYARGYEYGSKNMMKPISGWLSPSYTDVSVGIDWKPNEIFSVYVSPVVGRITSCTLAELEYENDEGAVEKFNLRNSFGMEKIGETGYKPFMAELGFSARAGVNYTRIENLKIISTVSLFTPYKKAKTALDPETFRPEDNFRRFGNFDIDWDFAISYQFLKVLNVTLNTSLKYINGVLIADKKGENPTERVQFKGNLGIGIGYSF